VEAGGHASIGPFKVRGYGTVKIDPDRPVEEKVDWLLQSHYGLVDSVHQNTQNIEKNADESRRQLEVLRGALEKAIGKVEAQTAKAHVGEIGAEFVGLGWILFGVTFATVPGFIESWFGWFIQLFEIF